MANGLFKYFSSTDTDKLERFTNGQVYLTPPRFLNDPWEFRLRTELPTEEQLSTTVVFLGPEDKAELLRRARKPDWREEAAAEQREKLSRMSGVVCLTENPLDRLMWAHYGESHKGFAAEFQHNDEGTSEFGFRQCTTPFGLALKVKYAPEHPELKWDTSNMAEVLLTKHLDWEYEQEWRVIQLLHTGAPHPTKNGFVLVRFKPIHLLRVIFGLQVSSAVKFQVGQMLNRKEFDHVRKEEVHIDSDSRELRSRTLSR